MEVRRVAGLIGKEWAGQHWHGVAETLAHTEIHVDLSLDQPLQTTVANKKQSFRMLKYRLLRRPGG